MIGIIVLGVVAVYCAAWVLAFKLMPNAGAKALVSLIAVGIPTWDLPIGYYHFRKHCRSTDGVRIHGELPKRGIAIVIRQPFSYLSTLKARADLAFFDVIELDGRVQRWRTSNGKVLRAIVPAVASLQEAPIMVASGYPMLLGWHTYSRDLLVIADRTRNLELAKVSEVSWRWGWIRDGVLKDLPGGVEFCDEGKASSDALVLLSKL